MSHQVRSAAGLNGGSLPAAGADSPPDAQPRPDNLIQSVDRALLLLQELAELGGCASLSALARRIGLNRSTVHGLLTTLRYHGMVAQDDHGNYVLGIRLFELGNLAVSRLDLRIAAGPILQQLVDEYMETVHLVVSDGLYVVYIDKRESPQSMQIVSRIGQRLPAYCTAVGKAILAFKPEDELDRLLAEVPLIPMTRNTITDPGMLRLHLHQVRLQGYALDEEEIAEGLRCAGAPIFDYTSQVVGAVSISGPSVRMNNEKITQAIQAVLRASREISLRLGYGGQKL
jgi:DNA-binding IclR family transcriptional regulator